MPVNRPANRANVHRLVRFDFSPAELAVGDEGLVLIDFLRRKVGKRDGPVLAGDEVDLLPAARTSGMMAPPSGQAGHAELMATLESAELVLGHCQANGALVRGGLCFLDDLLHPARHSRVDNVLSPLGGNLPLCDLVPELRHALLGVICVPGVVTSLRLAEHASLFKRLYLLLNLASHAMLNRRSDAIG